jgi:cysteinyl-tRNA synthetase
MPEKGSDAELVRKVETLISEFDAFMNDDLNTAKVLANMFELAPVINSIKDRHMEAAALGKEMLLRLRAAMETYLEQIFGLQEEGNRDNALLNGVLELLVEIRKDARTKKDFATSDKIRNQLQQLGVVMKDDKDGQISISFS